jgi:tetratricopeptide (TPR) repeat protein/transcriptional regulator with XRE-family HTH domain
MLDAALLKRLRKTRGLSQEALAELCFNSQLSVSIASIKRAETGKPVLYRTARHLAQILSVALEQIVDGASAAALAVPAGEEAPLPDAPAEHGPSDADESEPPAADAADAIRRHVILLHLEFAAPLGSGDAAALAEADILVQQFGGRVQAPESGARQLTAVFGLPQAFRSDAERAMRCAVELSRRMGAHGGRAIALRLVRWEDGAAAADQRAAPDLRSFDTRAAPVAGLRLPVHVARGVVGQLSGGFAFEAGPARLPGYRLFSKPALDQASGLAPLIGRYAETNQFKALLAATHENQAGHIVYLRAVAGVGKTRLSLEFADIARQNGVQCHRCGVADAGAESWRSPLEELARSLFALTPDAPAAFEQLVDERIDQWRLPDEARLFFHAASGTRMTREQAALFTAMSHETRERGIARALQLLILRLSLQQPLLITVEDIHWGSAPLFEALGPLLALTREAPVIWVLTSRVEEDPLETALRPQMYDLALSVFDLAPMGPREAAVLADQFPEVDPAYRRLCVERSQGNPLFLTQLLASPEDHLPDSLRHLIQGRVDGLAPQHARALRMAAVLGNRFDLALLRSALGAPDYEPQAGGRNGLLRPAGAGVYMFVHDLVMHCVLESIEPGQMRRLHRAAAAAYRERDAALCAHHLYRADDPGALEMMLRAIRERLSSHQYEAALVLTAECHAFDSTSYSSFALALLRAHAVAGMGRAPAAREAYQTALMLAGRPQDRIDAVVGLATALNLLEELEEEERLLDETLPLALENKADAALGQLLILKGNIYFPRGNFSECRRYHEDAVRHAAASSATETEARALSGLGDAYYAQGRMYKSEELYGACVAMSEKNRLIQIEASNRSALGSARIYLGQADSAREDALKSADLARQVGYQRAEVFSRMTAGWVMVAGGRLDEATQEVGTGLDLARGMSASRFEPFLMESEARVAWQRGDHAGAERIILDAYDLVERMQLHGFIGAWVLGTVALFARDAAVRKRALLKGAACLTRDSVAHNAYRFYVSAAEVSLLDGDFVSAGFYADQLAAYAVHEPCVWVGHHVELIRQFALWRDDPSQERVAALRQLRHKAAGYGFQQATPRLALALQTL